MINSIQPLTENYKTFEKIEDGWILVEYQDRGRWRSLQKREGQELQMRQSLG